MANVLDVAAYILSRQAPMTAMKLQKLVYYSQAWHLVWDEEPLFDEDIEAWANGPVVRELYQAHRGRFSLSGPEDIRAGDPSALTQSERDTVHAVLASYGDKSAHWLSELTHNEEPWRAARREDGLSGRQRGSATITQESMHEYYDSLTSADAEEL